MKERKIKMLKKQMFAAGMCTVLAFTTAVPTFAQETNASKSAEANAEYEKKESVYARLQADGTSDDALCGKPFQCQPGRKDYRLWNL